MMQGLILLITTIFQQYKNKNHTSNPYINCSKMTVMQCCLNVQKLTLCVKVVLQSTTWQIHFSGNGCYILKRIFSYVNEL